MLDERVRSVLQRLEAEDAAGRERGLQAAERSRAVARTTGQFLFALVAPQWDCEVLEIGGSRGYSTIWLAAGVRNLGGRVLSLENDPAKIEAAIANARGTLALREAGTSLEEVVWAHRAKAKRPPKTLRDLPATTPESVALSKELKRNGFRFVGPTTVYAAMQACGVVNDHIAACHVRAAVQRDIDARVG